MSNDSYTYKHKVSSEAEAVLKVKVSDTFFKDARDGVYKKLAKDIELKGFRKGSGPRNLVEVSLGSKLFEDTLNKILPKITAEIMEKKKNTTVSKCTFLRKKPLERL